MISHGQVWPMKSNFVAIKDYSTTKTMRELHRFLGMVGYYSKSAEISPP